MRRTGLEAVVSLANVIDRVVFEWDSRIASLLGAIMHESVFANVQVSASGAAAPFVWLAGRNVVLEINHPAVGTLGHGSNLAVNPLFLTLQWTQLAAVVVNDSKPYS